MQRCLPARGYIVKDIDDKHFDIRLQKSHTFRGVYFYG